MKRSRLIMLAIAGFLAVLVIWRVAFHIPQPGSSQKTVVRKADTDPNRPAEIRKTADADEPAQPSDPNGERKPAEVEVAGEVNEPMENLNLKEVEMKDIIQKLAEWTGKVIIPVDSALEQKITIYAQDKLPRSEALSYIYSALREKGIVAENKDNAIILRPIKDAKLRSVPTVPANHPLAGLLNKEEVVEKFFRLQNCSPTQLQKVIQPLVPEYGYVYAIESTSHIVVIDTVANLLRVQRIIDQLDIPEAEETVTRTFEIGAGDPVEIVQLLDILLADGRSGKSKGSGQSSPKQEQKRNERKKSKDDSKNKNDSKPAPSVVVGSSESPITLVPLPKRRWIIAKASAEDMVEIKGWIDTLDKRKPDEREHTLVDVNFVDVTEVAEQINNMIAQMPLRANVTVQALRRAKQLMIIGSAENREMVQQLITEIDKPSEQFLTEHIPLKFADPEQVKKNLEELYTQFSYYESSSRYGSYRSRYYRGRETSDPEFVRVIAYPTLRQVTVIASAENMERVKKQIKEWDKPIDPDKVAPFIIELKNTDPVKMADLLTRLFTETSRQWTWRDYYYGRGGVTKTMVGPLYGQLSFEAVPDTKKIIVQSKVPEGYEVVRRLVTELDREEMAEVPVVVVLKYADPEELCERLNAIFNEEGTPASIRRSAQSLSEYTIDDTQNQSSSDGQGDGAASPGEYTPPWSRARRRTDEMPLSNVIGRIRFIPDPRSRAILVLTPPEFADSILKMIEELDAPGKQVMVKAVILEVNHENMTSLGMQFASDPTAFGNLSENAVTALGEAIFGETHGSWTIGAESSALALVDFLIKETDAKILNQPTLWTKDNEQATFFKGQRVAFITGDQTSAEGTSISRSVKYEKVGVILQVRPNITPKNDVYMNINLMVSQVLPDLINSQIAVGELNTRTKMIVKDGETIMLAGILYQTDTKVERKVPLVGDLPLIGALFRHYDVRLANNELLAFITPYVFEAEKGVEAMEEHEEALRKFEGVRKKLSATVEGDES